MFNQNNKKMFVCQLMALVFFIVSMGCSRNPAEKEKNIFPEKIVFGVVNWPGYLPLYVADQKGIFKELGLNVEIKRYVSQAECSADYVAGKLQGRANISSEAIHEALQGLDHKIVLVIDYSNGSDGIIASKTIGGMEQLRGKRVAFEDKTLEEYFLLYALERYGLSPDDIVSVNLDPRASAEALMEGRVDVAVTYEPYLSATIEKIGGNRLFTSADAPGIITDLVTFRTDFIKNYPRAVEAFLKAYFRAFYIWKENPEEAHAIVAQELGTTGVNIAKNLEGIRMLNEGDNLVSLIRASTSESLYVNLRWIGGYISSHEGADESALDTDRLIDNRFIRNLSKGSSP